MLDIIIYSILIISLIVLIFILKINFKKIEIYEQWILSFKNEVDLTYKHLKEIDEAHIFEKDDDVGFVFQDILSLIKNLNEKVENDENS